MRILLVDDDAALGLDVEAVLMEGYRRVDEWHLIERAIDNFDVVFLRNEDSVAQMVLGRLTREGLGPARTGPLRRVSGGVRRRGRGDPCGGCARR